MNTALSGKLLLLYKDDGRPAEGRSNAHKALVDQARCVDVDDQADGVQAGAAHNDRDSDQEAGAAVRGPVFPAGASDRFFLPAAEDFDETGKGVDAGQVNHQVEVIVVDQRGREEPKVQVDHAPVEHGPAAHHVPGHGQIIEEAPDPPAHEGETQKGRRDPESAVGIQKEEQGCQKDQQSAGNVPDSMNFCHFSADCLLCSVRQAIRLENTGAVCWIYRCFFCSLNGFDRKYMCVGFRHVFGFGRKRLYAGLHHCLLTAFSSISLRKSRIPRKPFFL